jgi:hypothetical protein
LFDLKMAFLCTFLFSTMLFSTDSAPRQKEGQVFHLQLLGAANKTSGAFSTGLAKQSANTRTRRISDKSIAMPKFH